MADASRCSAHPDFAGRIKQKIARGRPGATDDPHGHGTHVAGSVLGSGLSAGGSFKGIAPAAELAGRGDETAAKVQRPDPVHENPGQERVPAVGQVAAGVAQSAEETRHGVVTVDSARDEFAAIGRSVELISAEVEGIRLGITLFDPYVAIMDRKRF